MTGRYRVGLLVVVALALGLRLYGLGRENLWIDEVFQYYVASQPVASIVANYRPGVDYATLTRDQAPLSLIVTHPFVREHDTELYLRLPSLLFSTFGVLVLAVVAGRLSGGPTALLAALFLATSPLDVWYGQEARCYAQWAALASLCYLALLRAMERSRAVDWGAYAACLAAAMYTFVLTPFVACAQAVTVLTDALRHRRTERMWRFVAAGAVAALLALPVLIVIMSEGGQREAGSPRPFTLLAIPYTVFAYAAGLSFGPTLAELHSLPSPFELAVAYPTIVAVLLLHGVALSAGIVRAGKDARLRWILLPWLAVPPLAVLVVSATTPVVYNVRYTLAALPAYCLVLAMGVATLRPRWLAAAIAAGILLVSTVSLSNLYWNPRYDKERVREALDSVLEREPERVQLATVGDIERAVRFYGERRNVSPIRVCGQQRSTTVPVAGRPLWLLIGRDSRGAAASCLESLRRNHGYTVTDRRPFPGLELFRLTVSGGQSHRHR